MRSLISLNLSSIRVVVGICAVIFFSAPVYAAKIPSPDVQEILVKGTISTFNDANLTDNYHVLREKMAKQFKDKFSEEKLAEIFKVFHDKGVDLKQTIIMKINYTEAPALDEDDVLSLKGYFDTTPNKTHFNIKFVTSDGAWKPIGINIRTND